jgi:hypothetical protein
MACSQTLASRSFSAFALGSMFRRIPKPIRVAVVQALGQALGIACFATGALFRSRSLRVLGLPSVAERNFRRNKVDVASARAVQLLQLAEAEPNDWNYGNAVHKAHLMLGRVALVRGDIDTAESELLAAPVFPVHPSLPRLARICSLPSNCCKLVAEKPYLNIFACAEIFGRWAGHSCAYGPPRSKMVAYLHSGATYSTSKVQRVA